MSSALPLPCLPMPALFIKFIYLFICIHAFSGAADFNSYEGENIEANDLPEGKCALGRIWGNELIHKISIFDIYLEFEENIADVYIEETPSHTKRIKFLYVSLLSQDYD